ncbi:MAG: HIT domain-containing protein [Nanoarchaeota archaeon]|nr:HIT domain-containing protein [Nanoarchaeota archaeon]
MKDVFCQYHKIKEDVIYQTNNFFVKVGFGLIAPGQVMIIPTAHYDSLADLPKHLEQEFSDLQKMVIGKVSTSFSAPFLIEYGNCGTVQHAHIHVIPKKSDNFEISNIIDEMIVNGGVPYQPITLEQFKENYQPRKNYVLIEDGISCVVSKEDFSGHRHYFSKTLGVPAVHSWSDLSLEEEIIDQQKREITRNTLIF